MTQYLRDVEAIWEILDAHSEVGLFRDWNKPGMGEKLEKFTDAMLEKFTLKVEEKEETNGDSNNDY